MACRDLYQQSSNSKIARLHYCLEKFTASSFITMPYICVQMWNVDSAKYELVKNNNRVDENQRHPHYGSNARDEIDDLGFDTGIGASAKCGII